MKDFVSINFSKCFKYTRKDQNLKKVTKSLYIFLTTPDEVEKSSDNCVHHYNVENLDIFDPELQLINTKTVIKSKFKEFPGKLKKFKIEAILVFDYKKRNSHKIFRLIAKLTARDSDFDLAFKSMHQSIMTKIKNYAFKDCIVLDVIINHNIKNFECYYKENK